MNPWLDTKSFTFSPRSRCKLKSLNTDELRWTQILYTKAGFFSPSSRCHSKSLTTDKHKWTQIHDINPCSLAPRRASRCCRDATQARDDRSGAQPLGCSNTGSRRGAGKSRRSPPISHSCNLKAALLGGGGSIKKCPPPPGMSGVRRGRAFPRRRLPPHLSCRFVYFVVVLPRLSAFLLSAFCF